MSVCVCVCVCVYVNVFVLVTTIPHLTNDVARKGETGSCARRAEIALRRRLFAERRSSNLLRFAAEDMAASCRS